MYRKRDFLKGLGLAAIVSSMPCILTAEEPQQKPNFIQILTDDQGWGDLGSFGHKFIQSPNIDRLAKEGIKFTRCYSADSVCSPSRAAILTGRTPYRNGVYRWVPPSHFCHLSASEITLPQLLRKNGYQTAHFGKWHLSDYSEERDKAAGKGHYKNYGYGGNPDQPSMNEYGYDYWFATGNVARPSHKDPENFFRNGKAVGSLKGYSAQLVAKEVDTWINEHRKSDKPFFMTVWLHEPHGPISSDPRFMERYPDADGKLQAYFGNITQIDEAVGAIVQSLETAGLTDDTLIWYTSDNGPAGEDEHNLNSNSRGSTGGLRGRKKHTHEGGIRVPGIIKWPAGLQRAGVAPGTICTEPIIGNDIFPTMLEVAGVPMPKDKVIDGTSILPLLQDKKLKRSRPLYWRNNYHEFQIALMEGDWKLVGTSQRTEFELYNLVTDPKETTDLCKSNPERFERMKAELIEVDREVLTEGPDWWNREAQRKKSIPGY
jgi:arylsulfatase A